MRYKFSDDFYNISFHKFFIDKNGREIVKAILKAEGLTESNKHDLWLLRYTNETWDVGNILCMPRRIFIYCVIRIKFRLSKEKIINNAFNELVKEENQNAQKEN